MEAEVPSLLLLEKVPAGGCGGDTLWDCRAKKDAERYKFCVLAVFSYEFRHLLQVSPPHSPAAAGTFSSRRRLFEFPSGGIRSSVALWPVGFRAADIAAPTGREMFLRAIVVQKNGCTAEECEL